MKKKQKCESMAMVASWAAATETVNKMREKTNKNLNEDIAFYYAGHNKNEYLMRMPLSNTSRQQPRRFVVIT